MQHAECSMPHIIKALSYYQIQLTNRATEMEPNYQNTFHEEESIDIKKYIFQILYHWWWFALSIFIALTIAYVVNRYSEKVYQVSCSLVIGDEASKSGSAENILEELSRVRRVRRAVVENEISTLKSYKMARAALEELDFGITYTAIGRRGIAETKLYHNCPFTVLLDTTKPNQTGQRIEITILSEKKYLLNIDGRYDISKTIEFGEPFNHPEFNFTILLSDTEYLEKSMGIPRKYCFVINHINSLANKYKGSLGLSVNDDRGSILLLTMTGSVPQQITNYLNKLCEVYIRANLEDKNQVSENTIRFIDEQLRGIVDSLETAGIRLQNFRSANKVIDLGQEGSFLFQQMEQLQSEKALLDINLRYYNYLLDYIKNKTDFSDIIAPSVVDIQDELLNSLVKKLNELNIQRRDIRISALDNSPQIILINSQIDNTRNTLLENLNSLIDANHLAMENLENRISKINNEVQKLPYTERQMINIQRDFNINDQIYTFLLEKRAEAGISKASNTPDHKVLDVARTENAKMIKPKASKNFIMALMLGGMIPLVLIVLIEFFNNKINDIRDIEQNTNVSIFGSVGHNDKPSDLPVFENPKSALAESFRSLRANLQYLLKEKDQKIICISSTVSGEGKTFCAANLAVIMAMAGKKTLLVSLDLRKPKVHRVFKVNNKFGLSTFLINKSNIEDIIQSTFIDNLYIANAGPVPPNPAELIGTEQMIRFFDNIKKDFNFIIIDTPPVAIVTDALLLKDMVDIYIFVIRHGYSTKQVLQLVDDLYNKKDVKNMALLINDVQVKGYYGYSYQYGYGYGYGYSGKEYYEEEKVKLTFRAKTEKFFKRLKY